uniref:Protein adenylyltransferase SelO, mitochondrial n=1 Tax=Geotrypetes seraphini TaxID=260995 RepID=A0A6P8SBJ3_GEOSA|nr:protein adenylyltransferase SelO, mitochondrial [Geotrypetes seraphini]
MLMLAESNPQLFAMIGSREHIKKELDHTEEYTKLQELTANDLLKRNKERWKEWLQKYSVRLQKERENVVSLEAFNSARMKMMDSNNPKYILRNYIAQNAIEAAENGDFTEVNRVLKFLEKPYQEEESFHELQKDGPTDEVSAVGAACNSENRITLSYSSKPPLWAAELCVT